jgi:hypothetical protein
MPGGRGGKVKELIFNIHLGCSGGAKIEGGVKLSILYGTPEAVNDDSATIHNPVCHGFYYD